MGVDQRRIEKERRGKKRIEEEERRRKELTRLEKKRSKWPGRLGDGVL